MNHQRTFHQRLLRSQRGSVLLMSVIAGIVISIMFFASITYIESQAKVMTKAASKSDRRVVMDGLYAYTVNAIKQSWCLTDTWVEDRSCSLNHPRNTQRLSLSDEALLFIRNSGTPHPDPITATRLDYMEGTVYIDKLTESHPLYSILQALDKDYSYVKFTIQRDSTAISAVRGREVPIKITVFLKHALNPELDQTLVSRNIIYPRELSYFGLILANDLNLGTGSSNSATGDVSLKNIPVEKDRGLRFESPIFVNGDMNLPPSSLTEPMKNVVFVDKVFLGGKVKMDGKDYIVKSAGGEGYMYNYSMPNFAGIMNGFEIDPAPDAGLKYLFNLTNEAQMTYDNQKRCRDRLMASYDLSVTDDAQLWIRATSYTSNQATIDLSLGNTDNFVEQEIDGTKSTTNVTGLTGVAATVSGVQGQPVMKVKAYFNGLKPPAPAAPRGVYTSEFYVYRKGTTTVYPTGTSGPAITFNARPREVNSRIQYNQVTVDISVGNIDVAPYIAESGSTHTAPSIKFSFEAFDYGYNAGVNLRRAGAVFPKKLNGINFTKSGNAFVVSTRDNDTPSTRFVNNPGLIENDLTNYPYDTSPEYRAKHFPDEADYSSFDELCFAMPDPSDPNADLGSFPAATWDTDFSKQARNSWSFDTEYAATGGYNAGGKLFPNNTTVFNIDSLVSTCTIGPNLTLFAGMVVCENFVIQDRSKPLRIIGTVIANQVTIHDNAYKAGIRWSTIYHPQAAQELIAAGILGKDKAGAPVTCNGTGVAPLWQSNIGARDRYTHWVCNPVSLRTADPFKWSTVDPDCGLQEIKKSTAVKCKKKTTRFLIKEVSRGKGL